MNQPEHPDQQLDAPVPVLTDATSERIVARAAAHDYYKGEFGLSGQIKRTPAEALVDEAGMVAVRAAIAAANAERS